MDIQWVTVAALVTLTLSSFTGSSVSGIHESTDRPCEHCDSTACA